MEETFRNVSSLMIGKKAVVTDASPAHSVSKFPPENPDAAPIDASDLAYAPAEPPPQTPGRGVLIGLGSGISTPPGR